MPSHISHSWSENNADQTTTDAHSFFVSGLSCSLRMSEVNSLAYSINQQMSTTTLALLLLLQRDVYIYKYLSRCSVCRCSNPMVGSRLCLPSLSNQQEEEKTDSMSVCRSHGCSITAEVQCAQKRIEYFFSLDKEIGSLLISKQCDGERSSSVLVSLKQYRTISFCPWPSNCTPFSSLAGVDTQLSFLAMWISLIRSREEKKERNQTLECVRAVFSLRSRSAASPWFVWTREKDYRPLMI